MLRHSSFKSAKSILLMTASAGCLAASPLALPMALAQDAPAPDEAGSAAATALQGVVITANRSAKPAAQVGQSVTVLTTADLRHDQETSVSDILDRTPGVSVIRNGGPGEPTSVSIRGADSDQTLVLIDGVKVNDPTDAGTGFDFSSLFAGDISRIEVLRGPQSTLYGSEAIGGVVNIITDQARRPLEANFSAEGGSFGTGYVSGGVGGADGPLTWRLSGYGQGTKGVPCFDKAFGGKRDCADHATGATGRVTYAITPDLQLDERVYYATNKADFDGFDTASGNFGDDSEYGTTQQIVDYTGVNLALFGGRLRNRLAYEYSAVDHDNTDPGQEQQQAEFDNPVNTNTSFIAHGRSYTLEYEGAFAITPDDEVVFGAQTQRSTLYALSPAFPPAADAHQTLNSGYAQFTVRPLQNLTLTGGARIDEQSVVGGHATGQASAAWSLNGGATILRASFGQGFKAPSLYQLYSPFGNQALAPEQANGWDAGIEQHLFGGRLDLQATYFGRITTNLIEFVSCFDPPPGGGLCGLPRYSTLTGSGGYYANVSRAEAQGLELAATFKATDRLTLSANYTLDDDEDRSPGAPTLGKQLPRRPKDTANLNAAYDWPIKLHTEVAVRYAGESYDDAGHTRPLGGYALIDLRAAYPLQDHVEVYGRIENLTDRHYETIYQYGTLGRAVYAGVRLTY